MEMTLMWRCGVQTTGQHDTLHRVHLVHLLVDQAQMQKIVGIA